MNLTTYEQIVDPRRVNLVRVMQSFPKRRFILLGDTSNDDAMQAYPDMVRQFPGQVQVRLAMCTRASLGLAEPVAYLLAGQQCIVMRNISATDPKIAFSYTTQYFEGLNPNLYQFIRTPVSHPAFAARFHVLDGLNLPRSLFLQEDLIGIDFGSGNGCRNYTFPQNVTFGREWASPGTVADFVLGDRRWSRLTEYAAAVMGIIS